MSVAPTEPETRLRLNGRDVSVTADPQMPLLYALRDVLGLRATRFGCGEGSCGACTVLMDGKPITSCDLPLSAVAGRAIETVEGLHAAQPNHPLLAALVDLQAAQCGYCLPGIIATARSLCARRPAPDGPEIRSALSGHLCRCGTHVRILNAVERAVAACAESAS
ncbi:(2Fe-2S)-binding protein [Solirhodobacter olei]|uniref:(2Fe-2S)-binding protein n=1 Tax=Solirhodobacter olei TaxID=2493082 RepID=UPI000FD978E9|nr:(2Fe-2S)-binding protein [Solirhodobacter olei]